MKVKEKGEVDKARKNQKKENESNYILN